MLLPAESWAFSNVNIVTGGYRDALRGCIIPDVTTSVPGGVAQYQSLYIAPGSTLTTDASTPLIIDVVGDCLIEGTISVSGEISFRRLCASAVVLSKPVPFRAVHRQVRFPFSEIPCRAWRF
eukprot:SAG22_NODE_1136_length_5395_cov_2.101189_3_plen_122_part_00